MRSSRSSSWSKAVRSSDTFLPTPGEVLVNNNWTPSPLFFASKGFSNETKPLESALTKPAEVLILTEASYVRLFRPITGADSQRLSATFNKYDNVLFAVFAPSLLCSLWEGTDLPRKSPYRIVLTKQEREELERRANKYTLPYFIVARAKMILLAAHGLANEEIANSLSTRREIVSRWRKRFFEKRLGGLEDFPRPGRPRVFPPRAGRAR